MGLIPAWGVLISCFNLNSGNNYVPNLDLNSFLIFQIFNILNQKTPMTLQIFARDIVSSIVW